MSNIQSLMPARVMLKQIFVQCASSTTKIQIDHHLSSILESPNALFELIDWIQENLREQDALNDLVPFMKKCVLMFESATFEEISRALDGYHSLIIEFNSESIESRSPSDYEYCSIDEVNRILDQMTDTLEKCENPFAD